MRERRCERGPGARNTLSCLTPDTNLTLVKLQITVPVSASLCAAALLIFACSHKALWPVPARELQGVPAGVVRLARMVLSWQAAVGFPTDSLCEHLPRSSPVLPAMWFALGITKFKKKPKTQTNLGLRPVGFRVGGKYGMSRRGESIRGQSCSCA